MIKSEEDMTSIERALKRLELARQEQVRNYFLHIPWNIFSERHGLFIPLFLLGVVAFIASSVNLILNSGAWSMKAISWHSGIIFLYVPFLLGVCFFWKKTVLGLAFLIMISTFLMAGFFPLNHFLLTGIQSSPFDLLPLSLQPGRILTIWQFIFNMVVVPATAISLLFHKSLEIYFNEDMKDELREMLGLPPKGEQTFDSDAPLRPASYDDYEEEEFEEETEEE